MSAAQQCCSAHKPRCNTICVLHDGNTARVPANDRLIRQPLNLSTINNQSINHQAARNQLPGCQQGCCTRGVRACQHSSSDAALTGAHVNRIITSALHVHLLPVLQAALPYTPWQAAACWQTSLSMHTCCVTAGKFKQSCFATQEQ